MAWTSQAYPAIGPSSGCGLRFLHSFRVWIQIYGFIWNKAGLDLEDIVSLRAPCFVDSGRLKGSARATFNCEKVRDRVLQLSGEQVAFSKGRGHLHFKLCGRTERVPVAAGTRTLLVKNLPYECRGEEVARLFSQFGECQVPQPPCQGRVVVQFKAPDAVEQVLGAAGDEAMALRLGG